MAPSSGHVLVPKALRILKFAFDKTSAAIRSKVSQTSDTANSKLVLQPIRISSQTDPLHPLARIRQARPSQHRWFSSSTRNLGDRVSRETSHGPVSFNGTKVGKSIRERGTAPFASTLRPNLTGGTLPRTANGYCLGGTGRGVRHFSQTPSCNAQVVQNVSAGIRAFFVGGGKARFDGVDPVTGEKRYRSVTNTENEVLDRFEKHFSSVTKGTKLEFRLSPTITALLPSSTSQTLGSVNVLDALAVDFARALKDLSLTLSDLRRLSVLGSLPLALESTPKGPMISVRFPGCDAAIIDRLCEELGVFRGIVREDEGWDYEKDVQMALLFPFAPTSQSGSEFFDHQATIDTVIAPEQVEWQGMMSPSSGNPTPWSLTSYDDIGRPLMTPVQYSRSHSGFESIRDSDFADDDPYLHYHPQQRNCRTSSKSNSAMGMRPHSHDFEGLEGIYRFLQECDDARR